MADARISRAERCKPATLRCTSATQRRIARSQRYAPPTPRCISPVPETCASDAETHRFVSGDMRLRRRDASLRCQRCAPPTQRRIASSQRHAPPTPRCISPVPETCASDAGTHLSVSEMCACASEMHLSVSEMCASDAETRRDGLHEEPGRAHGSPPGRIASSAIRDHTGDHVRAIQVNPRRGQGRRVQGEVSRADGRRR
jgi:hypothetical protein